MQEFSPFSPAERDHLQRYITGDPDVVYETLFESEAMRGRRQEFERRNFGEVIIFFGLTTATLAVFDIRPSLESQQGANFWHAGELFSEEVAEQLVKAFRGKSEEAERMALYEVGSRIVREISKSRPELSSDDVEIDIFTYNGEIKDFKSRSARRTLKLLYETTDESAIDAVFDQMLNEEKLYRLKRKKSLRQVKSYSKSILNSKPHFLKPRFS